jgi:hypothetical protein
MLFIVYCLLFNFVTGIPLAKLSNTSIRVSGTKDLLSQIMTFKDNDEALLSVLSDADPARLNEVITLLKALLTTSEAELLGLTTSSGNADTAFTDAVASHNAAIVSQTNGLGPLATTRDNAIATANTNYNNGVAALQDAVDAAKLIVDSTNSTKITANGVLAVDQGRLNSEITTLRQVIQLMEGLLGINTFSPTASPTVSALSYAGEYEVWYEGSQRSPDMTIRCDNTVERVGIFNDRLHFDMSSGQCDYDRDAQATMYIWLNPGAGKFECLFQEGTTIKGNHYTNVHGFWGTIEYRLISKTAC